jgi:hypothetical protein
VPEGVAYSADSKYIYVGDFTDKLLHIVSVSRKGLKQTGTLALSGHPASIRGPAFLGFVIEIDDISAAGPVDFEAIC